MRPATLIGEVISVTGSIVSVRIRADQPSTALVGGESHRVGQVGAFLRIPVGYASLFGVCTQVGAAAAPPVGDETALDGRWLTLTLFGEAIAGQFERGISAYPTFGDEVHLATAADVARIHATAGTSPTLSIGTVASTATLPAVLDVAKLVSRHSAVLGTTGSGKSNFVATLLQSLATADLPTARVLVIDAHGEYANALKDIARVFSVSPTPGADPLYVPFWALPFGEFLEATTGPMNDGQYAEVRAEVERRRREAAAHLSVPPPTDSITADAPVPFSARRLWYDLRAREDCTYDDAQRATPMPPTHAGNVDSLVAQTFPPHALGSGKPFAPIPRNIGRQLALMRNRLADGRYKFLFEPGPDLTPDNVDAKTAADLDALVASWVGHDQPITVLDMSGAPSDVLPLVTGTVLRIVYDALFWAGDLPVSGRAQPLLVVLEEAHLFVKEGGGTVANRVVSTIAKEGRKYGVGLMLVTQRPSDLDRNALSQCGTVIALRMTNQTDRNYVASTMPDDMALLADQLPALRTGEALISGEATPAPTRVRIRLATGELRGTDADVASGWTRDSRPNSSDYAEAIANWRAMTNQP